MSHFLRVADDVLGEILTYLQPNDVASFSSTCRGLRHIHDHNSVWRRMCERIWLIESAENAASLLCTYSNAQQHRRKRAKLSSGSSASATEAPTSDSTEETKEDEPPVGSAEVNSAGFWQRVFKAALAYWGAEGMQKYARIADSWRRIRAWLREHAPHIDQTLQPGLPLTELDPLRESVFADHSAKLPVELLISASIVGSQRLTAPPEEEEEVPAEDEDDGTNPTRDLVHGAFGVFGGLDFYDMEMNFALVTPEKVMAQPPQSSFVVAGVDVCTHQCFIAVHIQTGQVVRGRGRFFPVAPSWTDFLERHAYRLETGMYEIRPRVLSISRFPTPDPLGSDTETRGVRIQVSSLFVPELCRPREFMFTYRVRISYVRNDTMRARLTIRHWEIIDEDGKVDVVEGPGVVGLYPRVYAGCRVAEYKSCCNLKTRTGQMKGFFRFAVEGGDGDETFDAVIQPFRFSVQHSFA